MASYPNDWPQAKAIAAEACPDIAGRYLNVGIPSPDWSQNMEFFCSKWLYRRPEWSCEPWLAANLVEDPTFVSARAIEIRQPDSGTLLISVPDNVSIKPRALSRSHRDFECGAPGLTISLSGSDMDTANTALSLLVLHVGVASSTRSFRPLSDGSLLMDVTNEEFVTQELLSGTIKGQGFVRWDRVPTSSR